MANYTQFDYWFSVASETLELIDLIWEEEHVNKINSDDTCLHYSAVLYFYDMITDEARTSIFNCREELHEYYKKRYYVTRLTEGLEGLESRSRISQRYWNIICLLDKKEIFVDIYNRGGLNLKCNCLEEMDYVINNDDESTRDLDIFD
jgi:hypothetical protein